MSSRVATRGRPSRRFVTAALNSIGLFPCPRADSADLPPWEGWLGATDSTAACARAEYRCNSARPAAMDSGVMAELVHAACTTPSTAARLSVMAVSRLSAARHWASAAASHCRASASSWASLGSASGPAKGQHAITWYVSAYQAGISALTECHSYMPCVCFPLLPPPRGKK